jgi:hypothetical protein
MKNVRVIKDRKPVRSRTVYPNTVELHYEDGTTGYKVNAGAICIVCKIAIGPYAALASNEGIKHYDPKTGATCE